MKVIYVHIPYCASKCPYCDFASVQVDASINAYLRALEIEAQDASKTISVVDTLYVGGGTPTALNPAQIYRLFESLHRTFEISPDAEITVEANPCSLAAEKTSALVSSSVNRVSLGAQSFVDEELSLLGRPHHARDILEAHSLLRESGIENISIDLIYAVPNQSVESWQYSLARAIELKPEHISTYCLTFEPSTRFSQMLQRGDIEKKSDEEELALYDIAREILADVGYEHYEISNFALPGRRSRHNMVYWSNEEYLGLGASAVSYLNGKRITNLRDPQAYIRAMETRGSAVCETDLIPPWMQAVETMIQRLRLRDGIDCASFTDRFGIRPEDALSSSLRELEGLGLLECDGHTIKASTKGWHLANEVALRILP
ncbi:MAG: radical SAM family heme chaperone HemW [Candidatus Lindowbacteria bacterium]|nr:radical SAM family heme chaperone HemW [Candidatus Lindowbacteria bacterium]